MQRLAILIALCASGASALVFRPMRMSSAIQPSSDQGPLERTLAKALRFPTKKKDYSDEIEQPGSVSFAIRRLEKDLDLLDDRIGREPQLARAEIGVLISCSLLSTVSPLIWSAKVTELLVPALAALVAAIGVSSEYIGRVAVAQGKEVAAATLQTAAEAEQILSRSERVKAVIPMCVGVSTGCGAFSLLAPEILEEFLMKTGWSIGIFSDVFLLFWPFISVAGATVAGLAAQECSYLARRASGVGDRRMATRKSIQRTWLSSPEQISIATMSMRKKWSGFVRSILIAPALGVLLPGSLGFKAVVVSVVAAAQAAYYLTCAEYDIAQAIDKVAEKLRSAALADVYANQGARAGSILPFTSALAALCVAAAAAIVEIQPAFGILFPALGSVFAGAASVAKAQAEVDTAAASGVATALAESNRDDVEEKNPVSRTLRNSRLSFGASFQRIYNGITGLRRRLANFIGGEYRPVTQSDVQNLETTYRRSPDAHLGDSKKDSAEQAELPRVPGVVYETSK
uniref:H(+)-exporting diphosphatase n=1 Tax=Pinguiococcus pyrenoidosus TaxID=172671 RepID=A0A7R9UHJ8_9STRA|mmetsp:Transcript_8681/g.32706  ORF Transcript_8681/g.32706 Transcript_8681/m.32706 type:complete len:515 (+) Transcript_8681:86-1630(+)